MTRLLRAIQAIVAQLVAPTAYHALVRYRVVQTSGDRVELQIVRKAANFPDTLPINVAGGGSGLWQTPALGAIVLVGFVEGDPSMPIVTHYAEPKPTSGTTAFTPVTSSLDATGTVTIGASSSLVQLGSGSELLDIGDAHGRYVRYGDPILFGSPGAGTVELPAAGMVAKVVSA